MAPGAKARTARARARPSAVRASTTAWEAMGSGVCRSVTCSRSGSARGAARMRRGRSCDRIRLSGPAAVRAACRGAASSPSVICRLESGPGLAARHSARAWAAAWGSVGQGFGRRTSSLDRRSPAGMGPSTRGGAAVSAGAVASRAAGRPSRAARSRAARPAAMRGAQSGPLAQPSSITSKIRPWPSASGPGPQTGRARPRISKAAAARRISSTHQGVRAGLSSVTGRSRSNSIAGKLCARGWGGVTRRSQ